MAAKLRNKSEPANFSLCFLPFFLSLWLLFDLTFWPKTVCILAQNSLHFGPKRFAFWPKTVCILAQNSLHFAAKWNVFCRKTVCILPQNGIYFAAKRGSSVMPYNIIMCCNAIAKHSFTPCKSLLSHKQIIVLLTAKWGSAYGKMLLCWKRMLFCLVE